MNRPYNTLFMLMSLDGKISTGAGDAMDFDKDIPTIADACEGLKQYYDYEQTTDLHSMISGKILAKLGINKKQKVNKTQVSFIVVDNKNLTKTGVENIAEKSAHLYIATTNKKHPAFLCKADNITVLCYDRELNFKDLFAQLYKIFGVKRITIQTGGTLNAQLVREGYIDEVSVFIAPLLVGGTNTPTLLDGDSLKSAEELAKIKTLELISAKELKNSYVHMKYKVLSKYV
ncbi:MAG: dihydrofolate reductase family protein [Rickettsiales bacterium]|jgi:2,5-diamino-6-(ribosylamino)-4(3H)-pyrimidinone 5'-phosphate reductase|nr:dihydrofolate reductase family protein [Rickettsiales bacterium]